MVDVQVVVGFGWEVCFDCGMFVGGQVFVDDLMDEILFFVGFWKGVGGGGGRFGYDVWLQFERQKD